MTGVLVRAVFWLCMFLLLYTYFLYPVILFLVYGVVQVVRELRYVVSRRDRRSAVPREESLPAVSMVVAAFNEERDLEGKLQNIREIEYPVDRMQVIIVSDGSTDRTNAILSALSDRNIQSVFLEQRRGKANALNHGVSCARHDILILTDVSTLFDRDAVRKLVRHFSDPQVGTVCGTVRLQGSQESRQTEGAYWKYDSALRLMEGRLGATIVATGAIYATRRECFVPLDPATILDDLIIPMNARLAGRRIVHDPEAIATEFSAESVANEFTRRVRIAVGSFRALPALARVPLDLVSAWALVSHKILRWLVPFLLAGLLIASIALWPQPIYGVALALQLAFYLWAAVGWGFREQLCKVRFALVGYFLLAMHLAFVVGLYRCVFRHQPATWERVG